MSRGIHTKPNAGATVEWCTPPEIIEALGPFDLDPCACKSLPWRTARREWSTNGLRGKWPPKATVWLNPPYGHGASRQWMQRVAEHGNGIALVASRTEVDDWFVPFVWESATAILFLYGRLYYHRPDGPRAKGNAGHGSVLVAYGDEMAERLRLSDLRGRLVWLNKTERTA